MSAVATTETDIMLRAQNQIVLTAEILHFL